MLLRFWFSKTLQNKISLALILKRKSCICCRKHCRAYFRRHMECAVLKRFLKVQGTFLKKFLQNSLFHLKKLNLIRFIKALIKGFTLFSPHLSLAWHLPHRGENFKNIANGFTKNAMKLHFTKSFDPTFSKVGQGLGWNPKVFQFDKFIFILVYEIIFKNIFYCK